jgi:hypothetical protein
VTAFYERDPSGVRAAARMASFPPDEMVTVAVRFTRVLYAQLSQQRFEPHRRWPLPPGAHPEHKAAALGAKLTAGFEMLAAEWARAGAALPPPDAGGEAAPGEEDAARAGAAAEADAGVVGGAGVASQALPSDDDPGWRAYLAALERLGYFRGEIEGSRDYKAARSAAAASYAGTQAHARFVAAAAEPAARAAALLRPPPRAAHFGPPPPPGADDAEDWLAEGEALLERALAARDAERAAHDAKRAARRAEADAQPSEAAAAPPPPGDADMSDAAAGLGDVARGVRSFVAARGSLGGASVPAAAAAASAAAPGAPELEVDPSRFLKELSSALGLDWEDVRGGDVGDASDSDSDDASSMSDDLSDDFDVDTEEEEDEADAEADAAVQAGARAGAGGAAAPPPADWRRFRAAGASDEDDSDDASSSASDSDDEDNDGHARRRGGGFNAAYASALDAQLRGTAMASDFTRASAAPAGEAAAAVDDEEDDDDSRPVDVDLNLVQSLLASYTAQEGLPGPASNLLGLMGLALPHDADERPAGSAAADAGT